MKSTNAYEHDYLEISDSKKPKTLNVNLREDVEDKIASILFKFLHKKLKYDKKKDTFLLNSDLLTSFINEVDSVIEEIKKQIEEDSSSSSSSESSDCNEEEEVNEITDEDKVTIQEAFARKHQLKSRGDIIDDETIEESENEDVITMTRRIRFLLREIRSLKERVTLLEQHNK